MDKSINFIGIDMAKASFVAAFNEIGEPKQFVNTSLGINSFFTGHDARTIDVNQVVIDNDELISSGSTLASGDNSVAQQLAGFREANVFTSDSRNIDEFFTGVIGRLGSEAGLVFDRQQTRESLLERITNEREQLSGVSLDEEMARMIQFQRSFQAAARFISTVDIVLETLINM